MPRNEKKDEAEGIKVICRNKRAFHEYEISDRLECGLVLTGTEVKSLRDGHASLEDAYAKLEGGEVWMLGSDIPEYAMGNRFNHKPKRPRKLLLHRQEISKFAGKIVLGLQAPFAGRAIESLHGIVLLGQDRCLGMVIESLQRTAAGGAVKGDFAMRRRGLGK